MRRQHDAGRVGLLAAILFCGAIPCSPAIAQPDRAETLFAEAKSLAASSETAERSFSKFDEAASLFRAAHLSACQTGISTGDANGREVESLGMLAQKKGAKAVLATPWKVTDESTSLFMAEFYRIKIGTWR